MKILAITNLHLPQELGGYGRSISDFVWGFIRLGHDVEVLTSDAPYLNCQVEANQRVGPSGEVVHRFLSLKGSYENGLSLLTDPAACEEVDRQNQKVINHFLTGEWGGVLIGNIDLLGPELLAMASQFSCKILHHIGFIDPPFPRETFPQLSNYTMVAASKAVRNNLQRCGFPISDSSVVYPGVRTDLFGDRNLLMSAYLRFAHRLHNSGFNFCTPANPLKIGFAGLLMGTKGVHTLVEALILLRQQGLSVQAGIAGSEFESGYQQRLKSYLARECMDDIVQFFGQLSRPSLSRFWDLYHVGVFSSIYPEAFVIVSAELIAYGFDLVYSGFGCAA